MTHKSKKGGFFGSDIATSEYETNLDSVILDVTEIMMPLKLKYEVSSSLATRHG